MTTREIVSLSLRMLGIYFVVTGLSSLPSFIVSIPPLGGTFVLSPLCYIVSGLVLGFFAPRLSVFFTEFSTAQDGPEKITPFEKWGRLCLLILGVYILAKSFPAFIQFAVVTALLFSEAQQTGDPRFSLTHKLAYLIGPTLNMAIAVYLILGPDKIMAFLAKHDRTLKKYLPRTEENDRG